MSADLGGAEGLERLAETAHAHGLGLVVDVVPNHMALVAPEHLNAPLWQVLRLGREAPTAHWFDVDWEHTGGRFPLPLLGGPLDEILANGELVLDSHEGDGGPEPVIRYHDHVFPVAPGTGDGSVREVLARQHYLLASWRDKDEVLAYRRFFDVDTLVAVRVELPDVFDATHAVLVDLFARGVVDGFRVDHPDGLADPEGYLDRLRDVTAAAAGSRPGSWWRRSSRATSSCRAAGRAPAPPATTRSAPCSRRWCRPPTRRSNGRGPTPAESSATWRRWSSGPSARWSSSCCSPRCAASPGWRCRRPPTPASRSTPARLTEALTELLVQVDVYRCYVRPGHPLDPAAAERLGAAAERAHAARRDLTAELVLLERLLLDAQTTSEAGRDLIVRFQQTCGPVMAKGVEDTTFYRWHELVGLAEVGGDPARTRRPERGPPAHLGPPPGRPPTRPA